MNIETLVANLERTIAGKQLLLQTINHSSVNLTDSVKQLVQINIDELQRILTDAKVVQQQVEKLESTLNSLSA